MDRSKITASPQKDYNEYCRQYHALRIEHAHNVWQEALRAANTKTTLTVRIEDVSLVAQAMQNYLQSTRQNNA